MCRIEDRRNEEQQTTHTVLIVGTDPTLTEWGREAGRVGKHGRSLAAWACRPGDADMVTAWVKRRGDLKGVRRWNGTYAPGLASGDHLSVYVVDAGHPALEVGRPAIVTYAVTKEEMDRNPRCYWFAVEAVMSDGSKVRVADALDTRTEARELARKMKGELS